MDNWYRNGSVVVDGVEYAIWRNLGRNSWFVMEAAYGQISCDLVGEKDLGRALAAMRKHKRGGTQPTCECGKCKMCLNREAVRRHRKRQKKALK